jgi:hypothetical protein
MTDGYMSPDEIRRAAADLLPLVDEVLEHSATLNPILIKVYQPGTALNRVQRLIGRALGTPQGQRSVTEHAGYKFIGRRPTIYGVIFVEKGSVWIAAPYHPVMRRSSDLHVKHSLRDYVDLCLADSIIANRAAALRNIDEARYAIERLLPDGHSLKRPKRATENAQTPM